MQTEVDNTKTALTRFLTASSTLLKHEWVHQITPAAPADCERGIHAFVTLTNRVDQIIIVPVHIANSRYERKMFTQQGFAERIAIVTVRGARDDKQLEEQVFHELNRVRKV